MKGKRKTYDPAAGKAAKNAEFAVFFWLRSVGYSAQHLPDGDKGVDIRASWPGKPPMNVEVEQRHIAIWERDDRYPFDHVHVPERRQFDASTMLVIIRRDLRRMIAVFPEDVRHAPLKECSNRLVAKGEYMRQVPIQRCLQIDPEDDRPMTIGERNAERVEEIAREGYLEDLYHALKGGPPNGMKFARWDRLWKETQFDIEKTLQG